MKESAFKKRAGLYDARMFPLDLFRGCVGNDV